MTILNLLGALCTVALSIIGLTAVSNFFFFPRLKPKKPVQQPKISILVPARNEAAVISQTIQALLRQTYTHFELLLLDDQSEDGTGAIAREAAGGDPRFRLLPGAPLPPGWLGKNWACHQLAQATAGEWLLFADADVQWQPEALASLLAQAERDRADLLTVWPTQLTRGWAERLVVPLMAVAILGYLPILPVHYSRWTAFAAANGQCLFFRRAAYDQMGGHMAVRNNVIEDVALARQIKANRFRLRMADGQGLIACRMYQNWQEVKAGFAKNILAGHGGSIPFLLLSTLFHWLIFLFPWVWFLATFSLWPLALLLAGIFVRLSTAVFTRQRAADAFLLPLSVLLMSRIAVQSIWWRWQGQAEWKGRILPAGE